MDLKALIFANSYKDYLDFIREYHLKETECKYVSNLRDVQGYRKHANPDLLLICLRDIWINNTIDRVMADLIQEFDGQVYHAGGADTAAKLIQLTYITRLERLPEYLSHEDEAVRDAAIKRQEELNGLHNGCRSTLLLIYDSWDYP